MSSFRAIEMRPSSDSKEELQPGESSFKAATHDSHIPLGKTRRRRAPSHVSQNACTNCKKARAKVKLDFNGDLGGGKCPNRIDSVTARSPPPAHAASAEISLSSAFMRLTLKLSKRNSCGN